MNDIKYIRDGRDPIGVMFTVLDESGNTNTGFSFCNDQDSFDKQLGKKIAKDRAILGVSVEVPNRKVFCEYSQVDMSLFQMLSNELNIFPGGDKENVFHIDFSQADDKEIERALIEFIDG